MKIELFSFMMKHYKEVGDTESAEETALKFLSELKLAPVKKQIKDRGLKARIMEDLKFT